MSRAEVFNVRALVVGILSNRLVRAKLKNGHQFVTFCSPRDEKVNLALSAGDEVWVELSPFDLSKGRLLSKNG